VPSYTVGYIDVYRNGVKLGTADFTATSGTSVVLASGATAGDLVETISFFVSSVLNAIPAVANAVTTSYINDGAVTAAKMAANGAWAPAGTVIQVVNAQSTTGTSTTSATMVTTGLSASITPKFSTSKIFAQFQFRSQTSASGVNNAYAIYRGATNLTGTTGYGLRGASSEVATVLNLFWMDSPSTTSSTTYTLYFSAPLGGTNQINPNNSADFPISITLMEISA
jgi:hypothetical protein